MPSYSVNGLTTLLFRLPTELRLEIYKLCLPAKLHFLDVSGNHRELQWLATSKAIFQDAAPLIYSETFVYFDLEPHSLTRQENVEPAVVSHCRALFKENREWTSDLIRSSLVRRVMIEVWCSYFDNMGDLLLWLATTTAPQLGRMTGLEELCISLRNLFIGPKDEAILSFRSATTDREHRYALARSKYLHHICWNARKMKNELPAGCKVRWSLPGDTLPQVSFLRVNVPEQPPTEKETMVCELMENVWQCANMPPSELLRAEIGLPICRYF